MTKITVNIKVDTNKTDAFSKKDIESLIKEKQDFIDGKTTARNWSDIEEDLDRIYI